MEVSPEKQAKLNELNWMWDGRPPDKFGWGISKNKTTEYGNTIYHLEVPTGLDKPSKTRVSTNTQSFVSSLRTT
jgi:hypothetical protein